MPWDCSGYWWKRSFRDWGWKRKAVVPEFCYLGDMLSAGGGCELAAITCCKCAWGKFRQLLPLLTNRHLPLLTRGKVYSSCVRSVMLHAAETWAMKVDTLNRLRRIDHAMIRWICNVRAKDEVSSDSLLTKLGIQDLDEMVWTCRAQHRLDCRSTQAECGCTEKIWQAKEIMGWSTGEWQKEARYGFCWPSEPFWVERTPSRKTCQKAQPSVEENRALKWIWYDDDDDAMIRNWCNPISHYTKLWMGMESEHWLTLPNTRCQVWKTELTAVSQLGGLQS